MMAHPETSRLVLPALFVANTALACGPWLVRLAASEGGVGPVAAGLWRMLLALPVFIVWAWRVERPQLHLRASLIIAVGGVAFAFDLALWHIGILATRLSNAALLSNITALTFPLYGFWIARRWPAARQWLALGCAGLGIVLLMGRSYSLSSEHLLGDLACLGAGLCYTVYLMAADHARGHLPPITMLAIAALPCVPILYGAADALGETIVPRDWTPLILLTLGSQLIGQGLLLFAVARATPLLVGIMLLFQPVVSSVIGLLVYGERLTLADAIGALGIAAAVLLVRDQKRPERLPPAEGAVRSAA
jgi:drug/metabolite transporter (DMT)-like permease